MNNDRLVLFDGTKVPLISSSGMNALHVLVDDKTAACRLWEKFMQENLKQITIENQDDVTVGKYQDMILDHIEGWDNKDGTVHLIFCLREKTVEELLTERIAALETGQQAHDVQIAGISEELTGTQVGLAETYEMLEGLAGGN